MRLIAGGEPRHRERITADTLIVNKGGYAVSWPNNVNEVKCRFICRQITDDQINPWLGYQRLRKSAEYSQKTYGYGGDKGLRWDVGGPFTSTSYTYEWTGEKYASYRGGSLKPFFDGAILPRAANSDSASLDHQRLHWRVPPLTNESDLDAFGTTAITRVAPVSPHSNVLQGLVELRREGLPSLPGYQALRNRSLSPKQVSGEYLNYEFGLKPLISEIRATANAMKKSEDLIKQYIRDSGRLVRRRYNTPEEVAQSTILVNGSQFPAGGVSATFVTPSSAPLYVNEITRTRRWFAGTFSYYADPRIIGELEGQIKKAEYLFGLKPDMSDLYNLTPWTWLIDWFSNTGDVINNLKMFTSDGLVMVRGYVMEHVERSSTYWLDGMMFDSTKPVTTRQTYGFSRKHRRRANPFGFGLSAEDLTPRQLAILAALGITQSGRWQG